MTHPYFTKTVPPDSSLEPHWIYFDDREKEGFQGIIEGVKRRKSPDPCATFLWKVCPKLLILARTAG
jgi:hypothetical protein